MRTWGKKDKVSWNCGYSKVRAKWQSHSYCLSWRNSWAQNSFWKSVFPAIQGAGFQTHCEIPDMVNQEYSRQCWTIYCRKLFCALPRCLSLAGVRIRSLNLCFPCCRQAQCHNVLSQHSQCQVLSVLFQRAEQRKKKQKHLLLSTKSLGCLWDGCPWSQGQHTWTDWEGGFHLLWKGDAGKIRTKWPIIPSDTVPKHPKEWCTQWALQKYLLLRYF